MKATIFFALAMLCSAISHAQEYSEAQAHDEMWKKTGLSIPEGKRVIRIKSKSDSCLLMGLKIVVGKGITQHTLRTGKTFPTDVENPILPKTPEYSIRPASSDTVDIVISGGEEMIELSSPPGYRIEAKNTQNVEVKLDKGYVHAEGGAIEITQEPKTVIRRLDDASGGNNSARCNQSTAYKAFINCDNSKKTEVILSSLGTVKVKAVAQAKKSTIAKKIIEKLRT